MTEDKVTALRARMMEDMRIRGMGDKAQKSHIRAIKDFAKFLKRSPDTATAHAETLHLGTHQKIFTIPAVRIMFETVRQLPESRHCFRIMPVKCVNFCYMNL